MKRVEVAQVRSLIVCCAKLQQKRLKVVRIVKEYFLKKWPLKYSVNTESDCTYVAQNFCTTKSPSLLGTRWPFGTVVSTILERRLDRRSILRIICATDNLLFQVKPFDSINFVIRVSKSSFT